MLQEALDDFALAALACMDRFEPPQLGGLFWSLGKLWGAGGQARLPLDGKASDGWMGAVGDSCGGCGRN